MSSSESFVIWPPTGKPINTMTIDEVLDTTSVEALILAPSLVEELVQLPESLARLEKVQRVLTGGGMYHSPVDVNPSNT